MPQGRADAADPVAEGRGETDEWNHQGAQKGILDAVAELVV